MKKLILIVLVLIFGSIQAQPLNDSIYVEGPREMTLEELEKALDEINSKKRRKKNKGNLLLQGIAVHYNQDPQNYKNYYYRKKKYQR